MTNKRGNRPKVRAQQAVHARQKAMLERRKIERRRQLTTWSMVAVGVAAAAGLVAFLVTRGDDKTTVVDAAGSTTTTVAGSSTTKAAAAGSAAGKPCVAVADPLPTGAPAVPVKVGPPPTDLITEDLKPGTGAVVATGQTLTVNYIGVSCSTGKIFDSSYSRGEPASFPLSGVIPGWQKGIPGMKVGGQRLLGIPAEQGYGDRGSGSNIAPGETLWFVVEVLEAK